MDRVLKINYPGKKGVLYPELHWTKQSIQRNSGHGTFNKTKYLIGKLWSWPDHNMPVVVGPQHVSCGPGRTIIASCGPGRTIIAYYEPARTIMVLPDWYLEYYVLC